ncbi:MAG: PepSY domain-containing protein [Gammaproteobacteria bacterium]|nr:PepSY domain-containing protein [Gammaproteobacteria bacterium]
MKRNASAERLNFDLHKTFGAVTSPLFLIILLSGVYMNLPEYVRPVVDLFSPASGWPEGVESGPAAGRVAMRPGQALAASETVFADGELMGIELPDGPQGAYAIRRRAPDEVTQAYPHRQVWIDQYSGAILAINDPHRYTAGQKFLEWQFPLHSGEAFGLPGRITVLILGLVPPLLYATGFIRWLQKRRAASRKRELTAPERTRAR